VNETVLTSSEDKLKTSTGDPADENRAAVRPASVRPASRVRRFIAAQFRDGTVRRFLFMAAVAFWIGGFTFYTTVVIHVGHAVLGSQLKQGFITQRVTGWLNVAGAVVLPVLLWNTVAIWRVRGRVLQILLMSTWLVMAAVQVELFALHPVMDRLLDARARAVLDYNRFDVLHAVYVTSSTVQWAAGLLHVWCAVAGRET
jgi:hypothetical protein